MQPIQGKAGLPRGRPAFFLMWWAEPTLLSYLYPDSSPFPSGPQGCCTGFLWTAFFFPKESGNFQYAGEARFFLFRLFLVVGGAHPTPLISGRTSYSPWPQGHGHWFSLLHFLFSKRKWKLSICGLWPLLSLTFFFFWWAEPTLPLLLFFILSSVFRT